MTFLEFRLGGGSRGNRASGSKRGSSVYRASRGNRGGSIRGKKWVKYRVLIKYCVFSKILKYIPDSGLSRFPLGVSECTQWQVKPQLLQQKNHNIIRKTTIFNQHPVSRKEEEMVLDWTLLDYRINCLTEGGEVVGRWN